MSTISLGLLTQERARFHAALLGSILTSKDGTPSNADKDNKTSKAIAAHFLKQLGEHTEIDKQSGQNAGKVFEQAVRAFLARTFLKLDNVRPGRWEVTRIGDDEDGDEDGAEAMESAGRGLAKFQQYEHLATIAKVVAENPGIAAALGRDYLIQPDTVVVRLPYPDAELNSDGRLVDDVSATRSALRARYSAKPLLHASVSCTWTLRSDRAQNARSEALNLIRNRKGRLPHIAVVTCEPLPSRLGSLALGTGDIDCVYHVALPELERAVDEVTAGKKKLRLQFDKLRIMIDGRRIKDISDLPLDLAV